MQETIWKTSKAIKSFDKLHRKNLQDDLIDKVKMNLNVISLTKYLNEAKNESFLWKYIRN